MSNEMPLVRASKAKLRKTVLENVKQLSQQQIQLQSRSIHERLFSLPEYKSAKSISVYLSMPSGEVSTRYIVEDALRKGKQVFVPYLYKETSDDRNTCRASMDMVSIHSEADYNALPRDNWGIPTPDPASILTRIRSLSEESRSASSAILDIIVIPGVAFDHCRRRLGHGKGFYDLFLHRYHEQLRLQRLGQAIIENLQAPFLVGLALKEQLLPDGQAVPTTSTDWELDALIIGDGSYHQKGSQCES